MATTPDPTRVLALEKAFEAGERVQGQQWGPDNYVTAARTFLDFLADSSSPKPDPAPDAAQTTTSTTPPATATPPRTAETSTDASSEAPTTPRQRDDDIPQF